jgi:rhamnose utilization protein RhaD (predicted bifunctional aldolase and dehydrogenase)
MATDSALEQDLEVGLARECIPHAGGDTSMEKAGTDSNGEKVSAVVTQRRAGGEGKASKGRAPRGR